MDGRAQEEGAGTGDDAAVGERIEALLDGLRASTEARVWLQVEELVRLVTELYGAGLARAVELAGPEVVARLAGDELVGGLLVLHDLHPDSFASRVERAVDAVRPTLRKGGAEAAVTAVDEAGGSVVVTVTGTAGGCGSTGETLRQMVRDAVIDAVADAESVQVRLDLATPPTPIRLGVKPAAAGRPS